MRADSGFYAHTVVAVCRRLKVRFSITVRQHASIRRLIEAIPDDAWTPIPYWLEGGADVAQTSYTPFADQKDAQPVRLIVRRVRPTPGSQLAAFVLYDYHPFITDRAGDLLELFALQSVLVALRTELPAVAALHPLNGVAILLVSLWLAREQPESAAGGSAQSKA